MADKNVVVTLFYRNGEPASRRLLNAVDELMSATLPGADIKVIKIGIDAFSGSDKSHPIKCSPVLEITIDDLLNQYYYGERTAEELEAIIRELLSRAERRGERQTSATCTEKS